MKPAATLLLAAMLPIRLVAVTLPAAEDSSSLKGKLTAATNRASTLPVDATRNAFVYFDLSEIPAGAEVRYARLRVYFSSVPRAGAGLRVHKVTGIWSEAAVGNAPTFDNATLSTIDPALVGAKRFASMDVTQVVRDWIASPASNEGFAFSAVPAATAKLTASVLVGAKEGSGSGYPAELEVELGPLPVVSSQISPGAVQQIHIANGAVGGGQLAAQAVQSGNIANGAIGSQQLGSNLTLGGTTAGTFSGDGSSLTGITAASITGKLTGAQIADGAIASVHITSGAIGSAQLAANLALAGTTTGTFSGDASGLTNFNPAALAAAASANANFMKWVPIADAGNPVDGDNGLGAITYRYKIGKYEVTNDQYVQFLNAVASTADPGSLFVTAMKEPTERGGIIRVGVPGSYSYVCRRAMADKPVNYVSWYSAIRFANWMHNGMPTGSQGPTTTEDGAYTITGAAPNWTVSNRNPGAKVWLPTESEWYKAAYYDPYRFGTSGGYWMFHSQNPISVPPTQCQSNGKGDMTHPGSSNVPSSLNCANFNNGAQWGGFIGHVATVGSGGGGTESFYGAADMAGNVAEWNESIISGSARGIRGGAWNDTDDLWLRKEGRKSADPSTYSSAVGFRVATN